MARRQKWPPVPPFVPGRRPAREVRRSILRASLRSSFDEADNFLGAVCWAYHEAVVRIAGVGHDDLVPDMCFWALPEVGIDEDWTDDDWDSERRLPSPNDEVALQFAHISRGMWIRSGVVIESFEFDECDHWFADANIPMGARPSTAKGRWAALTEMAEALGGGPSSDFEVGGMRHDLEKKFRKWCDRNWDQP